ncbi:MAG: hypothetical protein IPI78_00180 [Chitinophagaceae bacterium]|nr:hypothetical protein [Chitinophagaceae bacterium]
MMPKNKDFALRIEIIDECLRNQYRKWTLQKLIDAINDKLKDRYGKSIGKRTIQDDIKYLKFDKMAPIEKRKEGQNIFFIIATQITQLKICQSTMKKFHI